MSKKSHCFARLPGVFVRVGYPKFYSAFTCNCARFLNSRIGRFYTRAAWCAIYSAERALIR